MLSAFFNKIDLYASFGLCQVTSLGCAYGAESVEPPTNLQLKLPAGFQVSIFAKLAENYGQPRMLAIDKQGRLYAALASSNQVVMLPDANADGRIISALITP